MHANVQAEIELQPGEELANRAPNEAFEPDGLEPKSGSASTLPSSCFFTTDATEVAMRSCSGSHPLPDNRFFLCIVGGG